MTAQPSAPQQTKTCPYCAETIRAEAVKCRYCGSTLRDKSRDRLHALSASPRLAVASLIIGVVSGTTEFLGFLGLDMKALRRNDQAVDDPWSFDGSDAVPADQGSAVLLVTALVVGVLGFVGLRLAGRRPAAASLILAAGGVGGLVVTTLVATNWILFALCVLLVVGAVAVGATAVARHGEARTPRGARART